MLISFKTSMKTRITESLFSKFPTKGYVTTVWLAAATTLTGCGDLFEPTISEICAYGGCGLLERGYGRKPVYGAQVE